MILLKTSQTDKSSSMKKIIYKFILFILLSAFGMVYTSDAVHALNSLHADNEQVPVIPQDSATQALFYSFTLQLDSADNYAQNKAYEKAVKLYASSFDDLKLYNEQRRAHAEKYLASLYETEEKEERIAFLEETLPLRKKQNMLLILLSSVCIVVLILLFLFLKYRLRNLQQRAEQKETENRLMELEKEEKQLENRVQTHKVEKYQKEVLAESLLINHKNKVVDDLRFFFIQNPELNPYKTELEHIFRYEPPLATSETNAEPCDIELNIQDIHPQFIARLQQQAAHKLTSLDLEYCRMIFLKMSSKEMADILQVDPNTIRMGKYRLKQKLGLGKEEDLDDFIQETGTN